jgi:hypothetical protein
VAAIFAASTAGLLMSSFSTGDAAENPRVPAGA